MRHQLGLSSLHLRYDLTDHARYLGYASMKILGLSTTCTSRAHGARRLSRHLGFGERSVDITPVSHALLNNAHACTSYTELNPINVPGSCLTGNECWSMDFTRFEDRAVCGENAPAGGIESSLSQLYSAYLVHSRQKHSEPAV